MHSQGSIPSDQGLLLLEQLIKHLVYEDNLALIIRIDDKTDGAVPARGEQCLMPRMLHDLVQHHNPKGAVALPVDAALLQTQSPEYHIFELGATLQLLQHRLTQHWIRMGAFQHTEQERLDRGTDWPWMQPQPSELCGCPYTSRLHSDVPLPSLPRTLHVSRTHLTPETLSSGYGI